MPGLNGFEVCRRLKADPRTRFVPVVIITALQEPKDKVAGAEAGVDDFLLSLSTV
jgi:two-component system cell cycle response regulator